VPISKKKSDLKGGKVEERILSGENTHAEKFEKKKVDSEKMILFPRENQRRRATLERRERKGSSYEKGYSKGASKERIYKGPNKKHNFFPDVAPKKEKKRGKGAW